MIYISCLYCAFKCFLPAVSPKLGESRFEDFEFQVSTRHPFINLLNVGSLSPSQVASLIGCSLMTSASLPF
jgi:hypothetical protein